MVVTIANNLLPSFFDPNIPANFIVFQAIAIFLCISLFY